MRRREKGTRLCGVAIDRSRDFNRAMGLETRFGVSDEWHLVLSKAVQHKTFGFESGFHKSVIRFRSPLCSARFITVGSISDSMNGDGFQ